MLFICIFALLRETKGSIHSDYEYAKEGFYIQSPVDKNYSLTLNSLDETDRGEPSAYTVSVLLGDFNEEVFQTDEAYRSRDALFVVWDENKLCFWVYSGDVGTFFWEYNEETDTWVKYLYANNKQVTVPDALKSAKPNYYD